MKTITTTPTLTAPRNLIGRFKPKGIYNDDDAHHSQNKMLSKLPQGQCLTWVSEMRSSHGMNGKSSNAAKVAILSPGELTATERISSDNAAAYRHGYGDALENLQNKDDAFIAGVAQGI